MTLQREQGDFHFILITVCLKLELFSSAFSSEDAIPKGETKGTLVSGLENKILSCLKARPSENQDE